MAKLTRGRIEGIHGMKSQTATELRRWAVMMEAQAQCSRALNDPSWLQHWAARLRALADKKENARWHKAACRRGSAHST